MSYSSIMGADKAPAQPSGRSSDLLGPSDNSDSGSDAIGTHELHSDSDSTGTGERGVVAGADAREGADIMPDRVVQMGVGDGMPEADADEFTDLDEGSMERAEDEGEDDEDAR